MNKLVRFFADTDLRYGYDGLSKIAKDDGLNLLSLKKGHFVAFVNHAKTKVKLCTSHDVLCYLRLPRGRTLDPRVIKHLPEYFNGTTIEYDAAMRKVLMDAFPKWFSSRQDNKQND